MQYVFLRVLLILQAYLIIKLYSFTKGVDIEGSSKVERGVFLFLALICGYCIFLTTSDIHHGYINLAREIKVCTEDTNRVYSQGLSSKADND